MSEPMDWPTIKDRYPELAARLRDGDMSARVEFAILAFGAEVVSVTDRRSAGASRPSSAPRSSAPRPGVASPSAARPVAPARQADPMIPLDQSPNPPF